MEQFILKGACKDNTISDDEVSDTGIIVPEVIQTPKTKYKIKSKGKSKGTPDTEQEFIIDGVIKENIQNYNSFILSKRKQWRVPETDLKVYIIEHKVLPHSCKLCNAKPTWRNKPLELVLDRINNEVLDNNIENLRFLCPNCYSQVKQKTTIFEKNIAAKMVKCDKCGKRIKYKTFSVNKQTNVEHYCKLCLEQERLEARFYKIT
jgi:hypothetical protein